MTKYGMLIDLKSCTGCKACMTACKANHNIPFGEHDNREYYRIWPMEQEVGIYPYVIRNMTPLLCMQCKYPPCAEVCTQGALYRRDDGIVLIDEKKCNGCKLCITACPYDALYFREDKRIVDKCTFCVENIDNDLEPECVKACPSNALYFGDLNDSESLISKLIKEWGARPLHPEYHTEASVYYTAHAARLKGIIESKKTGKAVQNATIHAKHLEKDESNLTYTDSNGVFFFWDLEMEKKYIITIIAEGFLPSTYELYFDKEYTDLGKILISKKIKDT